VRKLILMSVLLLVSASAQAAESRGLVLASDATIASTDALPRPLPPVAKNDAKNDVKNDVKNDTKSDEQAPRQQASAPAAPHARPHAQSRRYEANEATARRIAARYGISW
jgi:hypothetical protein